MDVIREKDDCSDAMSIVRPWLLSASLNAKEYKMVPKIMTNYGALGFSKVNLRFPVVAEHQVESGLWCKPCQQSYKAWNRLQLDADTVSRLVPSDCTPDVFFHRGFARAWTKQDFPKHIYEDHAELRNMLGLVEEDT